MQRHIYTFGPTTLELVCAVEQACLLDLFQLLFQLHPALPSSTASLRLQLTEPLLTMPTNAQELFLAGNLQLWQCGDAFLLNCGETKLQIDPAQGAATGRVADDFWAYSLAEQREFFQLVFFLLLRRQGYYVIHANALQPPLAHQQPIPPPSLLVVGDCGAGKTTFTLSLLQAGWRSVGDDLVILASDDAGFVVAHGLRRGFSCTPTTAAAFPALQPLMAEGLDLLRDKKFIQLDTLYPAQFTPHCTPQLLLFPEIVPQASTQLTPLTASEAMHLLLSQPRAGILVDQPTVAGHLQIYGQLIRQVTSHRILLGQDVLVDPHQVSQLLQA